jgi:hypothetical protein
VCDPLVDLAVCTKKLVSQPILDGKRSNRIGVEYLEGYNKCVAAV